MTATKASLVNLAMLVGRFIIVFGLIPNALRKLSMFSQTAAGMGGTPQIINGRPFPGVEPLFYFPFPEFFLAASLTFDMVGAILIIVGFKARPVATFMFLYCLLAMAIYHYNLADPGNVMSLMRSLPMVGGLMFIAAVGAGAWSIDGWLARRRQ